MDQLAVVAPNIAVVAAAAADIAVGIVVVADSRDNCHGPEKEAEAALALADLDTSKALALEAFHKKPIHWTWEKAVAVAWMERIGAEVAAAMDIVAVADDASEVPAAEVVSRDKPAAAVNIGVVVAWPEDREVAVDDSQRRVAASNVPWDSAAAAAELLAVVELEEAVASSQKAVPANRNHPMMVEVVEEAVQKHFEAAVVAAIVRRENNSAEAVVEAAETALSSLESSLFRDARTIRRVNSIGALEGNRTKCDQSF